MASQKNIKIKTGTLKRVFKEVKSYEKELQMEIARTEKMKAEGADSHDLKQQVSMLLRSFFLRYLLLQWCVSSVLTYLGWTI